MKASEELINLIEELARVMPANSILGSILENGIKLILNTGFRIFQATIIDDLPHYGNRMKFYTFKIGGYSYPYSKEEIIDCIIYAVESEETLKNVIGN